MYSMKEACTLTNMTYENLKFYCNEGLVPNVKRDRRNYRVFDEHDIKWIQSLNCLKSCGMSIAEMKQYLALCMEGEGTIPERKVILAEKKETLLQSITELQKAVAYIDWKQRFYDDVLSGKTAYYSNLVPELLKLYIGTVDTANFDFCHRTEPYALPRRSGGAGRKKPHGSDFPWGLQLYPVLRSPFGLGGFPLCRYLPSAHRGKCPKSSACKLP